MHQQQIPGTAKNGPLTSTSQKVATITLPNVHRFWEFPSWDTHTHNRFTALWYLSGTTRVSRYQKKHSPTHTHRGHQSSQSAFSIYYDPWHPPYSIHVLYSLFPQSLQVFFGLPLGLVPSTSYSIHFFTQSLSSFHSTCPYHCNLFRCSTEIWQ